MPPKKKKDGKKGKKKSAKVDLPSKPKEDEISPSTKEFYLVQIKDLEERVLKYQRRCDELEVKQTRYDSQYDQMSTDKKEIVSYLKKLLEEKGVEIDDLTDRLIGLQQAKDAEKDNFEKQLTDLRSEFKKTQDHLTSENLILAGKLASLEEFKVQREDLMTKLGNLEKELVQKDEDQKEEIYRLERKQVVDKDRLKKEMVLRVNQVAAEFRKVSNKQMAETTKRTIRENVSINAQLCKMSDKTTELLQENEELKRKEKELQIEIETLKTELKEHCKKHMSSQKIVRMLRDKGKEQEDLIAQYDVKMQQYEELEQDAEILKVKNVAYRDELEEKRGELENKEKIRQHLLSQLADEKKAQAKLVRILTDASDALRILLSKRTSEDAEESEYEKMEKRDNVLEHLLIILNSAAALGVGPHPSDFRREEAMEKLFAKRRAVSPSSMPGSGKGLKRSDVVTSPLAKIMGAGVPHYQLGDLGLIPRPEEKLTTNLEKMRELSATTRKLGQLKKLNTRSVGVQTISLPKAMFFAEDLLSKIPEGNSGPLPPATKHRHMPTKAF